MHSIPLPQIGALMNEAYQAHDGLPPELFPPDIPTYTGEHEPSGCRLSLSLQPAASSAGPAA